MPESVILLPAPRTIAFQSGYCALEPEKLIAIESSQPGPMLSAAAALETHLWTQLGIRWEICAGDTLPKHQIGVSLSIDSSDVAFAQGYRLSIAPDGVRIAGHDPEGVFYGVMTLIQLLKQHGSLLPCLEISDWPDYPVRGVMLDISRDKVYRMGTLYQLVDMLAEWKVNQLQLYTEHTFAYRNHPEVWAKSSPMTGEEILALDAYCRERFIELAPNQNSFGHMARWLKVPRYQHLAEEMGEFSVPWGTIHGPFSLSPAEPGSLALMSSLYDELLPHFTSRQINIGCDETFDLGVGKSKAICAEKGTGRVYLDFLLGLYENLSRRGMRVQFWGDIILRHPELVSQLPRDLIALDWGYEADHPFDRECKAFSEVGIPFYVCPGTSSWTTLSGRTDNCLKNLDSAAEHGLNYGAIGYLNTDWGDHGHWQTLPVSYLGFAMGAANAWCLATARSINVRQAVSRLAFSDPSGVSGDVFYDLGNLYLHAGRSIPNSSALFWMLAFPFESLRREMATMPTAPLRDCLDRLDDAEHRWSGERMARHDAHWIRREFALMVRMLRHACNRGLMVCGDTSAPPMIEMAEDAQMMLREYEAIWLLRNRQGGLEDSISGLRRLASEYLA